MTNRSKADQLQTKPKRKPPKNGKPFFKNDPVTGEIDPRINRAGQLKPRSVRELEALLDRIFDRNVKLNNGEIITQLEAMLTDMAHNKQAAGRIELLARRFGKVPQAVDVTSGGEPLKVIIEYADTDTTNHATTDTARNTNTSSESSSGASGDQSGA